MQVSNHGSRKRPIRKLNLCRGMKCCVLIFTATLLTMFLGCGSSGGGNGSATLYSIGGTVSGLSGTGLVLQNNGGNNSPVNANGPFALNSPIALDSTYNVTVLTQPSGPTQVCVVANGSGTATANVANIQVVCTTTAYTIGGMVSGLTGTGLVLQNNGGNNLAVPFNGPFTFTTPVDLGGTYDVTILTQPSGQICAVTNGSGTANAPVMNVQVGCSSTLGGTVTGLVGTGLVLQYNGGSNLPISSNGVFTFTTPILYGTTYVVTVLTQPSGPAQACLVLNGSGTANANVTNVQVNCSNNWTWEGGSNLLNQSGVYGTLGVAAAGNVPGARWGAVTWTDAAGDFWLYGGTGYDANGTSNPLGDLWEYSAGEWTWMGGSNIVEQTPTYGTQGVAAPANNPGARWGAAAWTDPSGNFWLFGGIGFYAGASAEFNDVWEYSGGEWTWVSGPNVPFQAGNYGTEGITTAGNSPGAREFAATWVDLSGNLWLFGGYSGLGLGSSPLGSFNDLWEYRAGQWTWMGGSNALNQPGTYGTLGTAAASNVPGARSAPNTWTDAAGNFWLFGGGGYDSNATLGSLSDLWKFNGSEWTWVGGSNMDEQVGVYGTLGVAASSNIPGARSGGNTWIDAAGNLWLFGGAGQGSIETFDQSLGDVWEYSAGEWTWMGGSNAVFQPAVYETLGTAGDPGGRDGAASWIDKSGNLWLFGGTDQGTSAHPGYSLNDLWKYKP